MQEFKQDVGWEVRLRPEMIYMVGSGLVIKTKQVQCNPNHLSTGLGIIRE